jgi:hypothetical protein
VNYRTVTTIEELNALPDAAIIKTRGGITFEKFKDWFREGDDGWQRPGSDWTERTQFFDDGAHLPITVIYESEESA